MDCFFSIVSTMVAGDDLLIELLPTLCSIELLLDVSFYTNHPFLKDIYEICVSGETKGESVEEIRQPVAVRICDEKQ